MTICLGGISYYQNSTLFCFSIIKNDKFTSYTRRNFLLTWKVFISVCKKLANFWRKKNHTTSTYSTRKCLTYPNIHNYTHSTSWLNIFWRYTKPFQHIIIIPSSTNSEQPDFVLSYTLSANKSFKPAKRAWHQMLKAEDIAK